MEDRESITEYEGFGRLAFVHRLPHPCIIGFAAMQIAEKVAIMREVPAHHEDAMHDTLAHSSTGRTVCRKRTKSDPREAR